MIRNNYCVFLKFHLTVLSNNRAFLKQKKTSEQQKLQTRSNNTTKPCRGAFGSVLQNRGFILVVSSKRHRFSLSKGTPAHRDTFYGDREVP